MARCPFFGKATSQDEAKRHCHVDKIVVVLTTSMTRSEGCKFQKRNKARGQLVKGEVFYDETNTRDLRFKGLRCMVTSS